MRIRFVFGVALCAVSLIAHAAQVRSVSDNVYSTAQAARGQEIYKGQCAGCHGNAMEGTSGPPLVGDSFLSNWSGRPLANLVDKIEKTMPFNQPGSLTRPQSIDIASFILQSGKFPAGQTELNEAALGQIAFATVRTS